MAAEHAGAGRVADVQVRLPGLGLQRDHLGPERPRAHGVQVAALQLPVAGDPGVADAAVDRRDHLDAPRPVPRNERPLDPSVMGVGHADDAAAVQRRLTTLMITERQLADYSRGPDVKLMAVTEQLHVGKPDHVPALDTQLEDQPVRQVYQVLVEYGQPAQDRRLAVVTAVHVGAGIVHAVRVLPPPPPRPRGPRETGALRGQPPREAPPPRNKRLIWKKKTRPRPPHRKP